MRKVFFTLTLISLLLATFSSFNANSKASKAMSVPVNQNPGELTPGTRCTRLMYGPKEKSRKRPTAVDGSTAGVPGTRCLRLSTGPRKGKILPNTPPNIGLSTSTTYLGPDAGAEVRLRTVVCDPDGDNVLFTYSTTAGRIKGDGPDAVWDLSGAGRPGKYTVTVEVDDGCGCLSFLSAEVTVAS